VALVNAIAGVLVSIGILWLLLVGLLWVFRPRDVALGDVVGVVPDVVRLVRDLLVDPSAPRSVRLALVILLAWLVSPIDLIPEFIPILGPLDDAIVAVLVLRFVARRLGEDDLQARWRGSAEGWALVARILRGAR